MRQRTPAPTDSGLASSSSAHSRNRESGDRIPHTALNIHSWCARLFFALNLRVRVTGRYQLLSIFFRFPPGRNRIERKLPMTYLVSKRQIGHCLNDPRPLDDLIIGKRLHRKRVFTYLR